MQDGSGTSNGVGSLRELGPNECTVLLALQALELEPGKEFWTRRVEMAYEAGMAPATLDFALYSLARGGWIEHHPERGRGTAIRVLRRAA